jgi:hypothetical protein
MRLRSISNSAALNNNAIWRGLRSQLSDDEVSSPCRYSFGLAARGGEFGFIFNLIFRLRSISNSASLHIQFGFAQ